MMVSQTTAFGSAAALQSTVTSRAAAPAMFGKSDLEALAKEQNPVLGFYDPMGMADLDLWGQGSEASIGWLRHAEIKHGRVAMAAFVGYIMAANYETFGGALIGYSYPPIASGLSAPEVWDALPFLAKLQIIGFIGVLEHISEDKNFLAADGMTHYMRGGKPGYMPTFSANVHPLPLNLYDPFRLSKNMDEATKAKRLNMEVNNGRLAMIGIFGFVCANTIPGSVPLLDGVIPAYSGAIMQPFNPVGTMESVWTVGKMW